MQDPTRRDDYHKKTEESEIYEIEKRSLIIRLRGELDHHRALEIRKKSDKLISRYHIKYIIFDFTNSNFMDSAGIGVIMGRYKQVIFLGGKIAVSNVNPYVDRIFKLSGLYKIIEKFDSVELALKQMDK